MTTPIELRNAAAETFKAISNCSELKVAIEKHFPLLKVFSEGEKLWVVAGIERLEIRVTGTNEFRTLSNPTRTTDTSIFGGWPKGSSIQLADELGKLMAALEV